MKIIRFQKIAINVTSKGENPTEWHKDGKKLMYFKYPAYLYCVDLFGINVISVVVREKTKGHVAKNEL